MVQIKSHLGNFLRTDRKAWTRDRYDVAEFDSYEDANNWIIATYGRNGLKYFFPVMSKPVEDDGAE